MGSVSKYRKAKRENLKLAKEAQKRQRELIRQGLLVIERPAVRPPSPSPPPPPLPEKRARTVSTKFGFDTPPARAKTVVRRRSATAARAAKYYKKKKKAAKGPNANSTTTKTKNKYYRYVKKTVPRTASYFDKFGKSIYDYGGGNLPGMSTVGRKGYGFNQGQGGTTDSSAVEEHYCLICADEYLKYQVAGSPTAAVDKHLHHASKEGSKYADSLIQLFLHTLPPGEKTRLRQGLKRAYYCTSCALEIRDIYFIVEQLSRLQQLIWLKRMKLGSKLISADFARSAPSTSKSSGPTNLADEFLRRDLVRYIRAEEGQTQLSEFSQGQQYQNLKVEREKFLKWKFPIVQIPKSKAAKATQDSQEDIDMKAEPCDVLKVEVDLDDFDEGDAADDDLDLPSPPSRVSPWKIEAGANEDPLRHSEEEGEQGTSEDYRSNFIHLLGPPSLNGNCAAATPRQAVDPLQLPATAKTTVAAGFQSQQGRLIRIIRKVIKNPSETATTSVQGTAGFSSAHAHFRSSTTHAHIPFLNNSAASSGLPRPQTVFSYLPGQGPVQGGAAAAAAQRNFTCSKCHGKWFLQYSECIAHERTCAGAGGKNPIPVPVLLPRILQRHRPQPRPPPTHQCQLCGAKMSQINLVAHMETVHKQMSGVRSSGGCSGGSVVVVRVGGSSGSRSAGFSTKPIASPKVMAQPREPTKSSSGYCHLCNSDFKNFPRLYRHNLKTHDTTFKCPICNETGFDDYAQFHEHETTHPELGFKSLQCSDCGKKFNNSTNILLHRKRVHPTVRPFKCPHSPCDYSAGLGCMVRMHVLRCHTMERPFECQLCGKTFQTGHYFKKHVKLHAGIQRREHQCSACPKCFVGGDRLKDHEAAVHGIVREGEPAMHVCHICGKEFKVKNYLYVHLRSHESPEQKLARRLKAEQAAEARRLAGKPFLIAKGRPRIRAPKVPKRKRKEGCAGAAAANKCEEPNNGQGQGSGSGEVMMDMEVGTA